MRNKQKIGRRHSENAAFVVEEKGCVSRHPARRLKHIFREHNQEADHLANLGVDGQRKITVEKWNNTENWKAVRSFWDVSTKTDGRSQSGVVIKRGDRDE